MCSIEVSTTVNFIVSKLNYKTLLQNSKFIVTNGGGDMKHNERAD